MSKSFPKDVERIIAEKKTAMEMIGVMISLECADMLIERNMRDAAYHFSVKCRNVSRRVIDDVTIYEGKFRSPMIARGKPATVALIKAFLANHVYNTEDEEDEEDDYSDTDINVYTFQSASTIQEACKMETRKDDNLAMVSSMHCREFVFSHMYTAHMRRVWQTLDHVIDFIGINELVDVTDTTKEPADSKESLAGV